MTDREPIFNPIETEIADNEQKLDEQKLNEKNVDDIANVADEENLELATDEEAVHENAEAPIEDEQKRSPKKVIKSVKKKVIIKSASKSVAEELDFSKYGKRRQSRLYAMFSLYSYDVNGDNVPLDYLFSFDYQEGNVDQKVYDYAKEIIKGTLENVELIDKHISEGSKNWNIERIHHVDKAILRFSIYSLLFEKSISKNIIIDEALEIAKDFSKKDSYKFINGILDGIEGNKQD